MKVIDLLNKIANEDKIPEKIKFENYIYWYNKDFKDYENAQVEFRSYLISCKYHKTDFLNEEVEIIEDTPKCNLPPYKDWYQQQIDFENKILLSKLESDTKLDIIKKYITSEEVIDNFKSIESRDEWLKVHDKILDIIDNFKLQNESGEIIEDTPKEDKKIEMIGLSELYGIEFNEAKYTICGKINEIINKINGE